jgi:lysophospholipase L1-like esterase
MTKIINLLLTPRATFGALVLFLFCYQPLLTFQAQTNTTPPPLSQQSPRNIGLFFDKLRAGKAITVAYFGGSITAGAGASDARSAYATLVTNWLRQQFKAGQISELNAGVAGTGVLYGAMRVRRDVIAYKPDLVFLEFSLPETNDAPDTEEGVKKACEGLLRQMLLVPQPPQIVLVHATNAKRAARVQWLDALAAHYQLPSLNLQDEVWKLLDAGQLKPAIFSRDGAWPNDEGHKTFANLITAFLAEQSKLTPAPLLRTLPTPLVSDEMNYGELRALAEFKHDAAWRKETNHDRNLPSLLLGSDKANAQLELYFEGSVLGLSYRVGPDGGMFECLIDGKPAPAPLNKIDCYDTSAHIQTRLIPGGLLAGEHKLTIRVLGEKHTKSSGNAVRLGSLLVGGQRPERL